MEPELGLGASTTEPPLLNPPLEKHSKTKEVLEMWKDTKKQENPRKPGK